MYAGSKLEQITSTLIFSCERNFNDTVLAAQLNLEWEVHKVGPQGDNWLALFAAKPASLSASPIDRQLTDTSLSLSLEDILRFVLPRQHFLALSLRTVYSAPIAMHIIIALKSRSILS